MKKVVILSAFLTPFRSGAEACAEEVAKLLKKDVDITIVTARLNKKLPRRDTLDGVPVVRVGFGMVLDKWLFPFLAPLAVRTLRPDTIHAVLETFAGLALVFCKAPKKILTCQTTNRSFLKSFIVSKPNTVTAISTALLAMVQVHRKDTVVKIPNGIHVEEFVSALAAHTKVSGRVLFVGRLEQQKGVDTVIEAFSMVRSSYPNMELHIVGDGSKRNALNVRNDLDGVEFLGKLSGNDLLKEYAEAEVFCALSRSEALGNVFIEAQAAGCGVVGTAVGGIPDIVEHEQTGLLVPPDDAKAAADAISRYLSDAMWLSHISGNAKENAGKYDWSVIAKRYAELY